MLGDVRDGSRCRNGARAAAVALAVAIVVAFALTGCGDDGDGESARATTTSPQASTSTSTTTTGGKGSDGFVIKRVVPKKQVRRAVEAVLTSGDSADACGRYVTRRYLKTAYGDRQGCVQAQGTGSAAHSLRSFRVRFSQVAGSTRAVAVPVGGPYDGAKVEVSLIPGGPGYQVDALHADVPVGP